MEKHDMPTAFERGTAPLVSVIIPTYNRRELLGEAVESCLSQTYPNVEIIIVDDGSTDGTDEFVAAQLVGPWAGRVSYQKQGNLQAGAARNKGLLLARGEYVQFLDSDDVLFKDKFSLQIMQIEKADSTCVGCSCYGLYGEFAQDLSTARRIGICCATPREYIRRMCMGVFHGMQTSAPLWLRSFLSNRRGWGTDMGPGDDFEYTIRLLSEAPSMTFVDRDLFHVRVHEGPRFSDVGKNRKLVLGYLRTYRAVVGTVKKAGLWDNSVQTGILRRARTLYANILECGTIEDIRAFEKWVLDIERESNCSSFLPYLITCRRLLGGRAIMLAHRFSIWLRAIRVRSA